MKTIGAILAVLAAMLASCQERQIPQPSPGELLGHPNGLQVALPSGFRGSRTEDGFTLSESGDIRVPHTIQIELVRAPLVIQEPKERLLPTGALARFSIREVGAGSAGSEYELRASAEAGDRWIVVRANAQSEIGEPDFAIAWRLLESARRSGTR